MQTRKIKLFLCALALGTTTLTPTFAAVKIGDAFPDLTTFKLEGKLPSDLKGKVCIVDFWASWCGPCQESFPLMNELQKKYADKGLVIIAVNEDEFVSDMNAFLKSNLVSFTVVRDGKQKLVDKVEIGTMPSSFVLDKEGKVRFMHGGFHIETAKKEYEQQIESLLK